MKAYSLIQTNSSVKDVVSALRRISGVRTADAVAGPYDVICTIEAGSLADVGGILSSKIDPISGVARTITCLVLAE